MYSIGERIDMNHRSKKPRHPHCKDQRQRRLHRPLVGELLEARYLLTASPRLLADIGDGTDGSSSGQFVAVGNETYFTARSSQIWKTDGTTSGTVLVKDLGDSHYNYLHNHNGTLVIASAEQSGFGPNHVRLWGSDGTADGTRVLKDFGDDASLFQSQGAEFTSVGGTLFLAVGNALWKSDLTEAGTVRVAGAGSDPWGLKNVGGTLYFIAHDDIHGWELWKSDGTELGTKLVHDIRPGAESSDVYFLSELNGKLYFIANDGEHGHELWQSDGTESGTRLLKDIRPGAESSGSMPFVWNIDGLLYFAADDGVHGQELWKSDGTQSGTSMVKDICPGEVGSWPYAYESGNLNGQLFFTADDGTHGGELWKSDGTSAGTALVKDIQPGAGNSWPLSFATFDSTMFFSVDDGVHGEELWQSDGTTAGTRLVADVNPGSAGSYPWGLKSIAGMLFYSADDGIHGSEPWVVAGSSAPSPPFVARGTPSGRLLAPVSSAQFQFDQVMDVGSFALSDDLVSFNGPWGPIQADGFTWTDSTRLEIAFASQQTPGIYTMVLGPGITSTLGDSLDQDGDGRSGETPDDRFGLTFEIYRPAIEKLTDLSIRAADVILSPSGSQQLVTVTVRNESETTAANVPVRFRDITSGKNVGTRTISSISASSSAVVTMPWTPGAQRATIEVVVDPIDTIREKTNENNSATAVYDNVGSSPVVLRVDATLDGNVDARLFGQFIAGIKDVWNTFKATVNDPDGLANIDHVEFALGSYRFLPTSMTVTSAAGKSTLTWGFSLATLR